MTSELEKIMQLKLWDEFVKDYGYIKYSGPKVKRSNIQPKKDYLFPVFWTEEMIISMFRRYEMHKTLPREVAF